MARALALAARGLGETNPNPMVGCVIVRGGRAVGEGFHARAGGEHAERLALERAGRHARGATLYVNLEPCTHQGRTPPCAPLVRDAGIARVVAALKDPNPLVGGRGLRLLRQAAIAVSTGVRAEEAAQLNERFLLWMKTGRPFVLLKAALTLDGRIATAGGESRWITSAAQRRQARALRRLHDGVLVGIGTVLADDPLLLPSPRTRRPFWRFVLDSSLRLPPGSRLARSASPRTPVVLLCHEAGSERRRLLEGAGVEILPIEGGQDGVPARRALEALARRGVSSLMVEGGARVLGSFVADRLVDQVVLFRAPTILGGSGGLSAFAGPDPARLADALRLRGTSPLTSRPPRPGPPWPEPRLFEIWYPVKKAGGYR
jgi:diaminohydroxyphosphoribosylaminopyrimidine deaminase/5-amino-6-(5-phosphoribosylamino)uracil reductase